jgi:acyl carrier protein|tara:strand:+ start:365 stop:610 length:246 start_codon:yes stop_codon:yes gene_type:complete
MSKINLKQIISIVSKVVGVPSEQLDINSESSNFYKWDSLAQLNIVIEIEKKINKKIDASMMGELISIKLIVDHLKKMNAIS